MWTFRHWIPGSQLLSDVQTFLAGNQLYDCFTHRGGWCCQKKTIAIFTYNQWLLCIDMKTKVVQYESERVIWFPAFVWLSDIFFSWEPALWLLHSQVRVVLVSKKKHWRLHPQTATFEHRHANKNCSPCPKDQHKHLTYDMWHSRCDMWHAKCDMWHNYKCSLLSIDMKTKVVQHVPRIDISIWYMTCDMRNVTCDMRNMT